MFEMDFIEVLTRCKGLFTKITVVFGIVCKKIAEEKFGNFVDGVDFLN